jgi:hypothetical protein
MESREERINMITAVGGVLSLMTTYFVFVWDGGD